MIFARNLRRLLVPKIAAIATTRRKTFFEEEEKSKNSVSRSTWVADWNERRRTRKR